MNTQEPVKKTNIQNMKSERNAPVEKHDAVYAKAILCQGIAQAYRHQNEPHASGRLLKAREAIDMMKAPKPRRPPRFIGRFFFFTPSGIFLSHDNQHHTSKSG